MEPKKDKIKIAIIVGSTRNQRFGEKPAKWISEEAKKIEGIEAELIDLRDYPLPFFDYPQSPAALDGKYPNEVALKLAKKIDWADAFIIVSPEYNHGYSAVLKNALDYLYQEWNNKPVGFVSWGGVGGARSVEQLRLVAIELQMAPIRNAIHIPNFWELMDENGNFNSESLGKSAEIFFQQLIWWARALKAARNSS